MTHERVYPVADLQGRGWRMAISHAERPDEPDDSRDSIGLEVWPACHGDERGPGHRTPKIILTRLEALVMVILATAADESAGDVICQALLADLCDRSPALRQQLDEMWDGRRTP